MNGAPTMAHAYCVELLNKEGMKKWFIIKEKKDNEFKLFKFKEDELVSHSEARCQQLIPTDKNIDFIKKIYYQWVELGYIDK